MPTTDLDLMDARLFVSGVPHDYFAHLRRTDPVSLRSDPRGPDYWAVTGYDECVLVNRDWEHFSSARRGALINEIADAELAAQRLMMLNMDPPLHTRYRRLVNKGFTPRMVKELEERIRWAADDILDRVCERGSADFVTEIAAELPLVVIAELLGVPQEDRHRMFDWSNHMIGAEDPEYQASPDSSAQAAIELYAYAAELYAAKRADPHTDLMTVLTQVEVEGEQLSDLELEMFFLLLTVAGNETTRNLISGAMDAFFAHPDQWARLVGDRTLLPTAVDEMLRWVSPVMNFRRTATADLVIGGREVSEGDKIVFYYVSANRDEKAFEHPDVFDVSRSPNPHIAFGGGGPHFCLGHNLAKMEIRVMYDRLVERLPEIAPAGPSERLQSAFINGVKHLPVEFPVTAPVHTA